MKAAQKYYTAERACRRGHQNPLRYVSNMKCVLCEKDRNAGTLEWLKPKILTARQAARLEGHKTFDLGKFCWKQGHGTFRETTSGRCLDCAKIDNLFRERTDYQRQYRGENPDKMVRYSAKRVKRLQFATPAWLTDRQYEEIGVFYSRAASLTKVTCIPHEVDHIVPLQARTVCGLNVPWNLQVLTAEENRRKHDGLPWAGELICRTAKGYRGRLVKSY
jgi:5-methylcytosine-specific restriction endonuclease McrA